MKKNYSRPTIEAMVLSAELMGGGGLYAGSDPNQDPFSSAPMRKGSTPF